MNTKNKLHLYLTQNKNLFGNEIYQDILNEKQIIKSTDKFNNDSDLSNYYTSICLCKKCDLGYSRTNFVFGDGDPNADLFLIGEAPGKKEDLIGKPFVGRAGKLLDNILQAIKKNRHNDVYIANVLKCRPPSNRDPLPSEVDKCEPYLFNQINIIKPKLIVALGRVAARTILKIEKPLKEMRKRTFEYNGIPLRVTYHPSALLRNSNLKKHSWEDFQWIRDYLAQ